VMVEAREARAVLVMERAERAAREYRALLDKGDELLRAFEEAIEMLGRLGEVGADSTVVARES